MKPSCGWMLPVLALSLAPAARGEELTCEFDEGTRSVARVELVAGGWRWAPAAQAGPGQGGLRPAAPSWFMSAKLLDGASQGSLAGSHTPPATDYWAAAVHRRPSLVMLVEVGSDSLRTLAVSTVPDADGRLAATYSSQIGGPDSLVAEQLTGTCRSARPEGGR